MADKFEDLRTYIAIVEAGGVNAAAAKLEIAKSAASRRLSDLEQRLGVILIQRTTRSFDLTEAGRTFYAESRRILDDIAAVEARLRVGGGTDEPGVVVAADRALNSPVMVAVAAFMVRQPGLRITVNADVATAAADTLVVTSGPVVPDRQSRRIGELRSGVFAAPVYLKRAAPLRTPADLGGHDGVIVGAASPADWDFGAGTRILPRATITVADADAAMVASMAGLGLAWLPLIQTLPAVRSGHLVACLAEHNAATAVTVAKPAGSSAAVDALVDELAAVLAATS